jgi:hypothetical protein
MFGTSPLGDSSKSCSFDQYRRFRVGLETKPALERAQVVERLVDHRQTDDGVDHVRIHVHAAQHAVEQREAVAHREERDVRADIAHAIQEEHHAEQKQQMVVSRNHVLGAEIHEDDQLPSDVLLQECLVAAGHPVR